MKPLLIYGPRKSGTTLLQNLIDGNDKIMMIPGELTFSDLDQMILRKEKKTAYLKSFRSIFRDTIKVGKRVTKNPGFKLERLPKEDLLKMFNPDVYVRGLDKLGGSLQDMIKQDAEAFAKARKKKGYKYWASKSVGKNPKEVITSFKALFPESKIILNIRDPKFIVRSIILNRRRLNRRLPVKQIMKECYESQKIYEYYHRIKGLDVCFVRFEDIIRDAQKEMKRVSKHLGVPFNKVMTRPTIFGKEVNVATASKRSKRIFKSNHKWTYKLTLRERLAILAFHKLYKLWVMFNGWRYITYEDLK